MKPSNTFTSFGAALAGLDGDGQLGTLEAWRRLVEAGLGQSRRDSERDGDVVGDVLGALFEKLLLLRRDRPADWRRLLSREEALLRAELRQMARTIAMDLAPERAPMRALAQQVARVLERGVPPDSVAPLDIWARGRLSPKAVRAAVGWALTQPDRPSCSPYAIAFYLLRAYLPIVLGAAASDGVEPDLADVASRVEQADHAGKVTMALEARLAPEEALALERQLGGGTLDSIASELGCRRTKAHALAARARREVEVVVAELEEEWRLL